MSVCAQCGAELGVGRFCINCGHPVGEPASPVQQAPVHPATEEWRTDTAERPAVPTGGLFAPAPPGGNHAGPRTSASRPGWLPYAAGLLALLMVGLLGGWLLFGGDGETPTASDDSTMVVPRPSKDQDTGEPEPSDEPSEETGDEADNGPQDVSRTATPRVPETAPPSRDGQGNAVRYEASYMLDGVKQTCWRMPGDGTGETLTFELEEPTTLTTVGLVNGYAKTARSGGRALDWYAGNRRLEVVEWSFDDGTTLRQELDTTRRIQRLDVDGIETATVTLRLVQVSAPGRGPASRNYTAISEVALRGTVG